MGIEETLLEVVRQTGPWALAVLFAAALVEYVFPPFPGDLIALTGAFWAVHGVLPLPLVFLAVTAGSVAGAALDYYLGAKLEKAAEQRPGGFLSRRVLPPARVRKIHDAYQRHGDLLILVNRFLPGIRGLFFLAAGSAGMPFRRILFFGTISAGAWNALLLAAGWAVGDNLSRLLDLFRTYSVAAWIALGLAALGLLVKWAAGRSDAER